MSLSLLILDDNSYEREALKVCINWRLLGIDQIYLTENGKRGWEISSAHQPQIILSDIKMPEMDGMEFVRKLRASGSRARVIFLSAYDDFRYAQFALSQNAFRYLLKPVNTKELVDVVRQAVDDVITEELNAAEQTRFYAILADIREAGKEKYLRHFLLDSMSAQDRSEQYLQMNRVCDLTLVPRMAIVVARMRPETEYEQLTRCLQNLSEALCPAAAFIHGADSLVITLQGLRASEQALGQQLNAVLSGLEQRAHVALGCSEMTDNALELPERCAQAEASARLSERRGFGKCYFAWEKQCGHAPRVGIAEQALREAEECLRAGQSTRAALSRLEQTLDPDCNFSEFKGVMIRFVSRMIHDKQVRWVCDGDPELLSEEALYTAIIRGDSVPALMETIGVWLDAVTERFAFQSMDKKRQIALEIKRVIDTEYANNITLKYLSGKVFLSSNYTHILFKSIFGYTVNHYLTQVRIQKACELLQDTRYAVAQVAPLVGYEHSTYFFSIFKRVTGMTPAEYRRTHQKGEEK